MGFYGNITNVTRTQFSFDKIYANRAEMDQSAAEDEVYIGRYVLVEYSKKDSQYGLGTYPSVYKIKPDNFVGDFLLTASKELVMKDKDGNDVSSVLTCGDSRGGTVYQKGDIVQVPSSHNMVGSSDGSIVATEYYSCSGKRDYYFWEDVAVKDENGKDKIKKEQVHKGECATWEYISDTSDTFNWNYRKDIIYYGVSRGYDSTVWQKVLENGYEKYVMVAELNTVVPTFDLAADAPTQIPLIPHFDSNSTNVYYKLHWQPNWGFRIKSTMKMNEPQFSSTGTKLNSTISSTTSDKEYPSDIEVPWSRIAFNKTESAMAKEYATITRNNDGTSIDWQPLKDPDTQPDRIPAAIYFNKDGMNSDRIYKSSDFTYAGQEEKSRPFTDKIVMDPDVGYVTDEITLEPTGLSGQVYENHQGVVNSQPDTQELAIMLPTIGDSISEVWDLVYGGRKTNEYIKKTDKRNKDIEWYNARTVQDRSGLRMVQDGFTKLDNKSKPFTVEANYFNKAATQTIAGCINSVHDLMGMIIQPYSTMDELKKDINSNVDDTIYYCAGDNNYYRKDLNYEYTELPKSSFAYEQIQVSEGEFRPNLFFVKDSSGNYVKAEGTYNENQTYYVKKLAADAQFKNAGTLTDFSKGNYYYKEKVSNVSKPDYILDKNYYPNKQYYTLDTDKIDGTITVLGDEFTPGVYYIKSKKADGTTEYSLDFNSYNSDTTYYAIEELFGLNDVDSQPPYENLYLPGIFYYRAWKEDVYAETLCDDSNKNNSTFYNKVFADDGTYKYSKVSNPEVGQSYFQKIHAEKDPYEEEELNKEQFTYLIDNTVNGAGIEGREDLLMHYVVKANKESIKNYVEVEKFYPVEFDKDGVSANSGLVYANDGSFYIFNASLNKYLPTTENFNTNTQYYIRQLEYIYTDSGTTIDETPLKLFPYSQKRLPSGYIDPKTKERVTDKGQTYYTIKGDWYLRVKTVDEKNGLTYYSYSPVDTVMARNKISLYYLKGQGDLLEYYQIKMDTIGKFYDSNLYYYKVGPLLDKEHENSYILETNSKLRIENIPNYSLAHLTIVDNGNEKDDNNAVHQFNEKFYYPNHYYRQVGNKYELAQEKNPISGTTYFEGSQYYVISDTENILKQGMEWNSNTKYIPPTVTLGTRSEQYAYHELVGFARKLNTIHGLILKLNQILKPNDADTRDLTTVQGALNQLNDWIAELGKLDSQEPVIVDNYGRIHSAPITTEQLKEAGGTTHTGGIKADARSIKSDIFPMAKNFTEAGGWKNQWLTINIDGKPTSPNITLRHNYQPVQDTSNSSNMNNPAKDTVKLYTPIIDPMGHVVGHNDETVTLPYGFKTISTNGRGDDNTENAKSNPTINNVIADNTQDVLTINSGNKWIRIDTDANSDTLTISHDVHDITISAKTSTNLNNPKSDTITIQDTTYDAAGHVTGNQNHTYTLPYGFKTISTNGRASKDNTTNLGNQSDIVADNTQDTLGINSGNEWIKITTDANSDVLTISHDVKNTTTSTSSQNLSSGSAGATFDIVTYSFDSTNHFSSKDTKTITMPNSYGIIAGDVGNVTEASATHDTFTLSGDSWIKTTVSKDKVNFAHQDPLTTNNTTTFSTNSSPALGGTFSVPTVSYDSKGHISSNGTYTITLPSLKISGDKKTGDNVLTDLSYTENGTVFTRTYSKIGDLALTGYTLPTSISGEVSAADSLNTAIGKLQYSINKEITDRGTAITNAINALDYTSSAEKGKYVSNVSETDGIIKVTKTDFNPRVSFGESSSIPTITIRIGDSISEEALLPGATSEYYGIVLKSNDFKSSSGETVPSSKALYDAWNDCYGDETLFSYQTTYREYIDDTTWAVKNETKQLTMDQIISRMEKLEFLMISDYPISNKYKKLDDINIDELVSGGSSTSPIN